MEKNVLVFKRQRGKKNGKKKGKRRQKENSYRTYIREEGETKRCKKKEKKRNDSKTY